MLKVWAQKSREKENLGAINDADVKKDAAILLKEQRRWNDALIFDKRDQLELILMVKSINYARAVIAEFEKKRNNVAIETIINDTIKNKDLANAYSSLVIYIKNRPQYIAKLLATQADSDYMFSSWVMALASVKAEEWPKINDIYKSIRNRNLSGAIGDCNDLRFETYHELAAMIVDPQYKPDLILANVPKNLLDSTSTSQPQGHHHQSQNH